MVLNANYIVDMTLSLTAFGLDAKAQILTALVEAKLLPEDFPAVRLQMRSRVTRWNINN